MASNLPYTVTIAPAAGRDIRKLSQATQRRIARKLEELGGAPRPSGVEKLEGPEDLYRLRVGDYRIIYQVDDKARIVCVAKVGHRRDVYLR